MTYLGIIVDHVYNVIKSTSEFEGILRKKNNLKRTTKRESSTIISFGPCDSTVKIKFIIYAIRIKTAEFGKKS